MHYDASGKFQVFDARGLLDHLRVSGANYYVYLLCYPPISKRIQPFYVGIGQGERVFMHEREAESLSADGLKVDIIRGIRTSGQEVLRFLDGVFLEAPWQREQKLIAQFGLVKDGTGTLANEQRYAQSFSVDGVELRKYARHGNELPINFIRKDSRLIVGPRKPMGSSSVYAKIYATLEANPRVTGAELVELLLRVDFSGNQTIYAQSGEVSRPWLAKYIDGGFYAKNQYIQQSDGEAIAKG